MRGLLISAPPMDVFNQMALDEVLAQSHPQSFCLRFYRWTGPALTFGYAQRLQEVEALHLPIPMESWTRRPTGGGVVPHLDDLTFSCVFPDSSGPNPVSVYQRLHSALQAALAECGLAASLAESSKPSVPGRGGTASQCFAEPVNLDLMEDGEKILGGAIRRYGPTVLYQGSLQREGVRGEAPDVEAAVTRSLAVAWGGQMDKISLWPDLMDRAEARSAFYRSPEWIRRR